MGLRTRAWKFLTKRLLQVTGLYHHTKRAWGAVTTLRTRRFGTVTVDIAGTSTEYHTPTQSIRNLFADNPERDFLAWFLYELEEEDIVWDIGAHLGMYAFPSAARTAHGWAVAFEPSPKNVAYLREVKSRNQIQNVSIEPVALGASNRTEQFDLHEGYSMMNRVVTDGESEHSTDVRRGDDMAVREEIPHPTVVKIDVEGGELDVIEGLGELLDDCRLVLCEVHRVYGVQVYEVISELEKRGFSCRTVHPGGLVSNIMARRCERDVY